MRKKLKTLAALVEGAVITGDPDTILADLVQDSREVRRGAMFVAMDGAHVDGHAFIPAAVKKGAAAILTEREIDPLPGVAVLRVPSLEAALPILVPFFWDYPGRTLRLIGITGTNGKTTTSYLIRAILREAGKKTGLIGTIQTLIEDEKIPAHNTTPNVVDLQRLLARMVEEGMAYAVMEVSSHALDQNRVAGCAFDTAVFTNLTQDHLDYHGTMENYRAAKEKLFRSLTAGEKPGKTAVVNVDDPAGASMLAAAEADHITYAVAAEDADLRAVAVRLFASGADFAVQGGFGRLKLHLKVTGLFNVYNVLGAVGAALAENIPLSAVEKALAEFPGVPGRFELVDCGQPFAVVVDYAHTPDGLENILKAARQITSHHIITVFGCGGDRDKTKRPLMGRIAAALSDAVIVTSDNPRSEDPSVIVEEVMAGVRETIGVKAVEAILERREAIFVAIAMAQPGDTVVIAGKGHEDYQILKEETIHFDDREVAREALGGMP
ncbi:MAG: UDP-N-acetylmuramoyl-L-alanyl-D-glutamate--2,6-diaminopimelate ligase [Schwartzia sp. (in: firmicutes)]